MNSNLIYLKTEQLPKDVKARHGIKVDAKIPRLDVVGQAGYYPPLQDLKNREGMIFFYLIETNGLIKSSDLRRADVSLQCKAGNFSSIFTLDLGAENLVGYGYPAGEEFFKPKQKKGKDGTATLVPRPNPFYAQCNDGFLFIAPLGYSELEIVIVPNGKFCIQSYAKKYADGQMDDVLEALRSAAQPIFPY
jgi:hypothetical protein